MLHMSSGMEEVHTCHQITMPQIQPWGGWELLAAFSMWVVMMVAMMLPVVSPWILLFSKSTRRRDSKPASFGLSGSFLLGYLAVWTGYSALATLGQWGLHSAALLSPQLTCGNPIFGGTMLLSAGIYQWTPYRDACMAHCRSPLGFFLASWKEGHSGAFTMGFTHGLYCVGCCWALMALSFVFGVMNLHWMVGITVFLLIEKMSSSGPWIGKTAGLLFIAYGLWMIKGGL